jgi:hypothetical protein
MQVPEISQQDGSKAAETCQNGKMQQKNKQTNKQRLPSHVDDQLPPATAKLKRFCVDT